MLSLCSCSCSWLLRRLSTSSTVMLSRIEWSCSGASMDRMPLRCLTLAPRENLSSQCVPNAMDCSVRGMHEGQQGRRGIVTSAEGEVGD